MVHGLLKILLSIVAAIFILMLGTVLFINLLFYAF